MTRFFVPELDTATKRLLSKVTDLQLLSAADALEVHVTPSGEVMTRFPVPELDTATKRLFPKVTDVHSLFEADIWDVHTN